MIRLVVLVLLAANLLYLGWSRWIRDDSPRLVEPPAGSSSETATAQSAAASPPGEACTTLGPVSDETRALEIEQILGEMQLASARRTVNEAVREGWWVYVATASATAQGRALRNIQNAGISDAFAMPDDPEFRVSVGLFSDEARAATRAEAVRGLRLDAVVSERMQQQNAVWFDLANTSRMAVDLSRISAQGVEIQGLRLEDCPNATDVSIESILPQQAPAAGAG